MKAIIEYISEEDYPRYKELLAMAEEAKKNAPKAPRAPLTKEQQISATKNKIAKAQEALAKLLAEQGA